MDRWRHRCIWLYLAGAVLAWWVWCEVFITDDSYFYLVIARNIARLGDQTFSRVIPTNGFHPLWGYVLAAYAWILSCVNPAWLDRLVAFVPLSGAVLMAGAFEMRRFARNLGAVETISIAIPLVFLTYLGVLFSEAHLSWLCLAWLCHRATRPGVQSPWNAIVVGSAAGLCFLARLDAAFTVAAILIWWAARTRSWRFAAYAVMAFATVATPYLISNLVFFGGLMPVSGWMKSTFPSIELKGFHAEGLAGTLFGYSIAFGFVPLVVGGGLLAIIRPRRNSAAAILYALGTGSLCQFVYIALFTRGHTEPYWYYVQPVFFVSIVIGLTSTSRVVLRRLSESAGIGALAVTLVLLWTLRPRSIGETRQYVPEALDYLRLQDIHNSTLLVSDCPGKIAFFTDNSVFAVDLLTANRNFYRQMTESQDALAFIRRSAADAGRPLSHVFYMGNIRLLPSADLRSVSYFDPRSLKPDRIGQLTAADGLSEPISVGAVLVWRLDGTNE